MNAIREKKNENVRAAALSFFFFCFLRDTIKLSRTHRIALDKAPVQSARTSA